MFLFLLSLFIAISMQPIFAISNRTTLYREPVMVRKFYRRVWSLYGAAGLNRKIEKHRDSKATLLVSSFA